MTPETQTAAMLAAAGKVTAAEAEVRAGVDAESLKSSLLDACRAEVCAAFDELQASLPKRIQPEVAECAEDRTAMIEEAKQLISEGLEADRLVWQDHMTQQEALQGVLFLRLEKAEDELRRGRQKQRKPPAPPALPHPEPMLPEARVAGGQPTTQSLAGDLGKWAEELAAP